MADSSRIDDLRRRVQRDPASIAFAQLAEEYRRGGHYSEAVETCRAGLALHPGYLSARVTLGRALLELGAFDEAQQELELVLRSAPENLAAIRGVAETHQRRGDLPKALEFFKSALALARNDPDLQETVNDLTRELGHSRRGPDTGDGLTLDQIQGIFAAHVPPALPKPVVEDPATGAPPAPALAGAPPPSESVPPVDLIENRIPIEPPAAPSPSPIDATTPPPVEHLDSASQSEHAASLLPVEPPETAAPAESAADLLTIEHLERLLTGIYAVRADRRA